MPIGAARDRSCGTEIAPAFRPPAAFGVRQSRAGNSAGKGRTGPVQAQIAPDYTAVRALLIAPIKTAPLGRNILPENQIRRATLTLAQALAGRWLLSSVQTRKCL